MNSPSLGIPEPSGAAASATSHERRESVDRARELWIRRLIDLSRRNNLLYYRDLTVRQEPSI